MKKVVVHTLLVAAVFQPLLAFSNPYSTGGSSNALNVNNRTNQTFSVSLGGASASPSYTLATGQASGSGGKVATPISCDLAGFAANFDAQTSIANMGSSLGSFVKDSAQTWAVNKTLDLSAEQYAQMQCASKAPQIATKAAKDAAAEVAPEVRANVNTEVAKATATAAAAPKSVGVGNAAAIISVPDAGSIVASGVAMGETTVIAQTAADRYEAGYQRLLREGTDKCIDDAKSQFLQYVTSSMQILNGEFWNQISLDAQQCALDKQMANTSPSKALFNFVKNDSDKQLDLGIFTVRVGAGGTEQIEIGKSSDTQSFKAKETGARTDVLVDASNTIANNVLFNKNELDRWDAFKADWDSAVATGASRTDIDDVFKAHPINPSRSADARYADYWISKVYYSNIDNTAQVDLEQLQAGNAKFGQAGASGQAVIQMQMMTELRKMREQSLLQTRLLAQMVSQRNDLGGGANGGASNGTLTGAGVGATELVAEGKNIRDKVDSTSKDLLDISLE